MAGLRRCDRSSRLPLPQGEGKPPTLFPSPCGGDYAGLDYRRPDASDRSPARGACTIVGRKCGACVGCGRATIHLRSWWPLGGRWTLGDPTPPDRSVRAVSRHRPLSPPFRASTSSVAHRGERGKQRGERHRGDPHTGEGSRPWTLPYLAAARARIGRLRPSWQNCMALIPAHPCAIAALSELTKPLSQPVWAWAVTPTFRFPYFLFC
jgi:hypothetical protein